MKLDILAMGAHPDDVELSCSGVLMKAIEEGKKVGILDFTKGELGTRGTPEIRLAESAAATQIMGIHVRENLEIADGFFENSKENQLKIIQIIRLYQPDIIIANALDDRHPDHGKGAKLAYDASFLSGLRMIETVDKNKKAQIAWRPKKVIHYIQDRYLEPDFVVDITSYWEKKVEAIRAFKSQFFDPSSTEPESYISKPGFLEFIEARALEMGHKIGVKYGEGFQSEFTLSIKSLDNML